MESHCNVMKSLKSSARTEGLMSPGTELGTSGHYQLVMTGLEPVLVSSFSCDFLAASPYRGWYKNGGKA